MEECGLAVVTLSLVSVVDDAHKQTVKEENVYTCYIKSSRDGKLHHITNTSQITCEEESFSRRSLNRRRELKSLCRTDGARARRSEVHAV